MSITAEELRRAMTLPDDYCPFQRLAVQQSNILIPYSSYKSWFWRRYERHAK